MLPPEDTNADPTPKPHGPNGTPNGGIKAPVNSHGGELVAEQATPWNLTANTSNSSTVSQLDPIRLLRALRRRWLLASGVGICLALLAASLMWTMLRYVMKPKFTAYALLGVSAGPRKILFQTGESDTGTYSSLNTHALLIRSQFVLAAALRQPGISQLDTLREQSDPISWLEKNVQVTFPAQSEVLRIALTGERPSDLAKIVNALKKAYIDEVGDAEHRRRVERLTNLERIRGELESSIKSKKSILEEMAKGVGSGDPKTLNSKQQFAMQMHAQLQAELLRAQSELNKARIQAVAEKAVGEPEEPAEAGISDSLVSQHVDNDPRVRQLLARRMFQQEKVNEKAVRLANGKDNPLVASEQRVLAKTEKSLEDLREELRPEIAKDLAERLRTATQAAGGQTPRHIVLLNEQVNALQEQWELQTKDVANIGKSSYEIEQLRKDIDDVDRTTSSFAAEIGKLKIELQAPPRIMDLQEAEIPKAEDTGPRNRKISLAGMAGFGLGLFVVSFWEYRSCRVDSTNEVESSLGLRIMGSLPDLPSRALTGPNGSTKSYWLSLLSESIDGIRTTLLFDAGKRSIRTIMVTSAVGHEGKTTLATHLATSLARSGRRTILVDCDLRRPAVHELFGLPLQPGFAELIKGSEVLQHVICSTHVADLWVLPAGETQIGTAEGLTNGKVDRIFNQLKEEYEFIVIDSAPVLPVADSLIIAQRVDGVILSVLRGVSQMPRVLATQRRLSMLGIQVIGAVVNRVRGDVYGYGNYYQYQSQKETQS